jgi:hypothetical protein
MTLLTPTVHCPGPASGTDRRAWLAVLATATLSLAAAGALLATAPAALAQPATTPAATAEAGAVAEALARFQQASDGQSSAIDDAAERFTRLSAALPADPVLRAYAGAATAMRATTTWLPWQKLRHAEDGLAQIDKALAQLSPAHDAPALRGVPASLETRFVAASTFLALPGFFNRAERGRKLLDQVLASPQLHTAPLPFRSAVWLRAGDLAAQDHQAAQARQWYDQVLAGGAPQAAAARKRLAGL